MSVIVGARPSCLDCIRTGKPVLATFRCDFTLPPYPGRHPTRCERPLCGTHAVATGNSAHYCDTHAPKQKTRQKAKPEPSGELF